MQETHQRKDRRRKTVQKTEPTTKKGRRQTVEQTHQRKDRRTKRGQKTEPTTKKKRQ